MRISQKSKGDGVVNIIKEWYGKQGLLARFYSIQDQGITKYYVDYGLCRNTSLVGVSNRYANVSNIPRRYGIYVRKYLCGGR